MKNKSKINPFIWTPMLRFIFTLSVMFYVILILVAWLFTGLIGYTFSSDWALLFIAGVPLFIALVIYITQNVRSLRAKVGDFEIEFTKIITPSDERQSGSIFLDSTILESFVYKGNLSELQQVAKKIAESDQPPHLLVVNISSNAELQVEFFALRTYIYEISRVAPLEYIVFVDDKSHYLGFTTIDRFKARFPQYGIEMFISDLDRDSTFRQYFGLGLLNQNDEDPMKRFKRFYTSRYWNIEDRWITSRNFDRLGIVHHSVPDDISVYNAFQQIEQSKFPGLPVIDRSHRLIGFVTKENILREISKQILKQSENKPSDKVDDDFFGNGSQETEGQNKRNRSNL